MATDEYEHIALRDLRIGLFVDLDLGWMAHPFPSSRFKISNDRQIAILRGLGVERIRCVPAKSDPLQPVEPLQATPQAGIAAQISAPPESAVAQSVQPAGHSSANTHSAQQCERRFGETAQQFRDTMALVESRPLEAATLCSNMVQTLTADMLAQGEVAIRLLTEGAGDKSALHPVNVAVLSLLLGKSLGLQGQTLDDLGVAAFLHDVGKARLPERVRRWDSSLTPPELRVYQDHVAQSVQIARTMGLGAGVVSAIAQHHEMVDGSGFPQRLKADAITLNARILALVNRYDGLCNPGKPGAAMTPHEALALLFAQQKTRFDAPVLSAFIRMMGVYPPGSVVQLNDERHAMVVSVNSMRPLKPRVLVHEPSVPRHNAIVVDLEKVPHTSIRRSLKPSSLPTAALDYLQPRQRICYFFESAANMGQLAQSA